MIRLSLLLAGLALLVCGCDDGQICVKSHKETRTEYPFIGFAGHETMGGMAFIPVDQTVDVCDSWERR